MNGPANLILLGGTALVLTEVLTSSHYTDLRKAMDGGTSLSGAAGSQAKEALATLAGVGIGAIFADSIPSAGPPLAMLLAALWVVYFVNNPPNVSGLLGKFPTYNLIGGQTETSAPTFEGTPPVGSTTPYYNPGTGAWGNVPPAPGITSNPSTGAGL